MSGKFLGLSSRLASGEDSPVKLRALARRAGAAACGLLREFDAALMPRRCAFCGYRTIAGDHGICAGCRDDLPWLHHACPRCAQPMDVPLSPGVTCPACQANPPPYIAAVAPLHYEFPVDAGLKALKFRRKLYYAEAFAGLLIRAASGWQADVDAVLPVPLHWRRRAVRGFNQAEELCRPLAKRLSLPLVRGVVRRRSTPAQSGLSAIERNRNLRGAFVARRAPGARHVMIVDDVITTGATARHLALVLRAAGVSRVSVLAVARAARVSRSPPG